jgi:hypothetical protein
MKVVLSLMIGAIRSLIDYCIVDHDMFACLKLFQVLPNVLLSDHHPLEGQTMWPSHQPPDAMCAQRNSELQSKGLTCA